MSKDDEEEGIVLNEEIINNLRYPDDIILIAGNREDLQKILNKVVTVSENLNLNLNTRKPEYIVIE